MSLYSSFYSSLSGLSANSGMLGVIGNNLSNLNTIGFKGSSSNFQDLFNASLGTNGSSGNGNPMQVGLGTQIGSITQNFGQGSFQSTGNVTDMAISGQGFFMLQRSDGSQVYSRAGNFTIDKSGYLINPSGDQVLGWNRIGTTLTTNGTVVPVHIDSGTISPPVATTNISMTTNLNAADPIATGTPLSVNFTSPVQVIDSLGKTHTLLANYSKTSAGNWQVYFTTDDAGATVDVNAGAPIALTFTNTGTLQTPNTAQTITVSGWTDGAANSALTWDPTTSLTSFAGSNSTSATTQNGSAAGTIQSVSVDQNGIITGNFTNGQTIQLAEVALATFPNMNGLSKDGNTEWAQTLSSGAPNIGAANQGGRGTVLGGQLELSNVDTASEFTQLIVAQRGYQANSRVVTTADTLLQEVLNLVR